MKKLLTLLILSLFCTGCISGTVAGYGMFDVDSGVRVYKTKDATIVNITHKGEQQPNYKDIALILKDVFK